MGGKTVNHLPCWYSNVVVAALVVAATTPMEIMATKMEVKAIISYVIPLPLWIPKQITELTGAVAVQLNLL
jgi:hypothetical protein